MKQDLRTMVEKQKLDPNELMENGLTRKENEDAEKSGAVFSMVLTIISLMLCFYSLSLIF